MSPIGLKTHDFDSLVANLALGLPVSLIGSLPLERKKLALQNRSMPKDPDLLSLLLGNALVQKCERDKVENLCLERS